MEATSCLRMPDTSTKNLHCLLALHGRNPALRRHLALTFSPLSDGILLAGPARRIQLVMCSRLPRREEDEKHKGKAAGSRGRPRGDTAVAAATTVVLTCALGAMWLSWKGMACAWPFSSPRPSNQSAIVPQPSSTRNQMKSMKVPELVELLGKQIFDERLDKVLIFQHLLLLLLLLSEKVGFMVKVMVKHIEPHIKR